MKGQSAVEFLLIAVVLVSLAFYAFFTVMRESEINIALSAARNTCNEYALANNLRFSSLNYSVDNNVVTITPVFNSPPNQDLSLLIIRDIFCSLDQNVEPKNCTRNYNPPSNSVKFIMNYTVEE